MFKLINWDQELQDPKIKAQYGYQLTSTTYATACGKCGETIKSLGHVCEKESDLTDG